MACTQREEALQKAEEKVALVDQLKHLLEGKLSEMGALLSQAADSCDARLACGVVWQRLFRSECLHMCAMFMTGSCRRAPPIIRGELALIRQL